jgi:sulfatase modifying factor 1
MKSGYHGLTVWVIGLLLLTHTRHTVGDPPKAVPAHDALPSKVGDTCDNSIGMTFAYIPSGTFAMGSPPTEGGRFPNELLHNVTITHAFLMGTTDVTVGQFAAFVKDTGYQTEAEKQGWAVGLHGQAFGKTDGASWRNPGFPQGQDHPVVEVSWNDAVAFNAWLSRKEGKRYRLPTEAEWEYA